ncbi:rod shape-determining protein RodA [Paenibacillus sp. J31TS4]|uniref:FtsW/RodA/SpoVE family cell cycle protein n=1 Tax=Paenibacillus sp. J31TS4 TaxID=2807195 RepID=UPI001AFFE00B|nr:FtsW/RodA/SpoVE family cell cycle protein [Paenibacillus sp. J31TS4]GIP39202.1 rod shape-determining protein RodA [Paenibacillus sp. J31TS4]
MLTKLKRIDWTIVTILVLFMIISTMLIYSATVDNPRYASLNFQKKNLIYYGMGFFIFTVVTFVNYRLLLKLSWVMYGAGIVLLLGLYKFGTVRDGAIGWYELGGLDFQPAEFMKIALILAVASFMARRAGNYLRLGADVVPIGLIVLVPFVLVFQQPDLGNAVIYLVILLGMFWIGNIRFSHVVIGTAVCAGFVALFLYLYTAYHIPIKTYLNEHEKGHWATRIDTYLYPEQASRDERLQLERSKIAIGSGSLWGDGYLQGDSIHKNFIPVAYTDAIFVVVGEEFGFIGGSVLLMLFFTFLYRMILIALQTHDPRGSYIIIGIVSMYVFQIFENIGMWFGLLPVTGVTLPFISYGGTSLMINMVSIGLVMSILIHQEPEEELEV